MKLKHPFVPSTLAASVSLGLAGLSLNAQAVPIPAADCPTETGDHLSFVLDKVEGSSPWEYGYKVCNNDNGADELTQLIRDWELPFFWDGDGTDADFNGVPDSNESLISEVYVPEGWSWAIEEIGVANSATGWDGVASWQLNGDPQKDFFDDFFGSEANNPYNFVEYVLHFYTGECFEGEVGPECWTSGSEVWPGDSLTGFGLLAGYSSTNAPYQASWVDLVVRTGDPQFPMGGPTNPTIRFAISQIPGGVPEPGTLLLLGAGLAGIAAARKRRDDS